MCNLLLAIEPAPLRIYALHFALLLALASSCTVAGEEPTLDGMPESLVPVVSPEVKQGETIWLEKKISPSSRWVENLVKPLTSWIEKKIQSPHHHALEPLPSNPESALPATIATEGLAEQALSNKPQFSPEQAGAIANRLIPGNTLRVKLLNKQQRLQYRVKLISLVGEIHILYLDAHSGERIQAEPSLKPVLPSQQESS